jgi:hypothetical protein
MTDYTSLEILKGSLSHLPEDELNSIIAAVSYEQNARKNRRKQELVKKVVTILTELYNICDDSLTIECDNCGHETHLDFDVLAQMIEFQIE